MSEANDFETEDQDYIDNNRAIENSGDEKNDSAVKELNAGNTEQGSSADKTFHCSKCRLTFPKKTQRDDHVKCTHTPSVVIKTAEGASTSVFRNETSQKFHCCAPNCEQTSFPRGDLLKRHYALVHWPGPTGKDDVRGKPSKKRAAAEKDSSLTPPPILLPIDEGDTPNNVVVTCLRRTRVHDSSFGTACFLVCIECNSVLPPLAKQVTNHVRKHEKETRMVKRQKMTADVMGQNETATEAKEPSSPTPLEQLVSEFIDSSDFSDHSSPVAKAWLKPTHEGGVLMTPVPGVPIRNGFQCQECQKCFAAESSRDNHRCGTTKPKLVNVWVQRLLSGIGRTFVAVNFQNSDRINQAEPSISQRIQEDMDKIETLMPTSLPSHRQRNAWLRKSKWPELAASFIPEKTEFPAIVEAIKIPDKDLDKQHYKLVTLVKRYMLEFRNLYYNMEFRFLRLVMGLDEHGQVPTTGFRIHSVPSTSERYCNYLCGLICGLVRAINPICKDQLHLLGELNDIQADCCSNLLESIKNGTDSVDQMLVRLHEFLLSLWTPEEPEIVEVRAQTDSIVVRFLLLTSLQELASTPIGFGFMHVATITARCSMLIYWIRVTILMEIGSKRWQTDSGVPLTKE
jgi:hypothetical protein